MRKLLLFPVLFILVMASCGDNDSAKNSDKILLALNPAEGPVHIDYVFDVTSTGNGDHTRFEMQLEGSALKKENSVELTLTNKNIFLDGSIEGKQLKGDASMPDSVSGDAKLVSMSVFAMIGRTYRSSYTQELDKRWEVQVKGDSIVDSTENKMQFLLRYPRHEVSVGESWEKEIVVKSSNKMNCAAKYTLREVTGDKATIDITGTLSGGGDSFGNEYSIDGKISGTFEVDIKSGWPVTTEVTQDFTLSMGGNKIPMKYVISSKVR